MVESAKLALEGTVAGMTASPLTLGGGGGGDVNSLYDETGDPCAQVRQIRITGIYIVHFDHFPPPLF